MYGIFSEIFGGPLFSEIFSRWKYPYIVLRKNKTKINALIRPIRKRHISVYIMGMYTDLFSACE